MLRAAGQFLVWLGQGVIFLIVAAGLAVLMAAAFMQKGRPR